MPIATSCADSFQQKTYQEIRMENKTLVGLVCALKIPKSIRRLIPASLNCICYIAFESSCTPAVIKSHASLCQLYFYIFCSERESVDHFLARPPSPESQNTRYAKGITWAKALPPGPGEPLTLHLFGVSLLQKASAELVEDRSFGAGRHRRPRYHRLVKVTQFRFCFASP